MTEKDYSLLRPFDLEAAKGGAGLTNETTVFDCKPVWKYVAGPDSAGFIAVEIVENGRLASPALTSCFRLAPLCWVEGKPVYPGDELERANGKAFIPDMVAISGELRMCGEGLPSFLKPELLRWPRPKPVKRWINIYNIGYASKDEADKGAAGGRIACIEIELPPLPAK